MINDYHFSMYDKKQRCAGYGPFLFFSFKIIGSEWSLTIYIEMDDWLFPGQMHCFIFKLYFTTIFCLYIGIHYNFCFANCFIVYGCD